MTDTQVQELLNPRFKVVALWPSTDFRIGDIVGVDMPLGESAIKFYEEYPHLFKRLEWWEERKPEEMPKYVTTDGRVFKVEQYEKDSQHGFVVWFETKTQPYGAAIHAQVFPATEEEYLSFINQSK